MNTLKGKFNLKLICCWLLLLQMVNLSINPVRHQNYINGRYTYNEDLRINKIESVYELLSEYLFGKNVPETQDSGEQGITKVAILFHQLPAAVYVFIPIEKPVMHNHSYVECIPEFVNRQTSPPPQG